MPATWTSVVLLHRLTDPADGRNLQYTFTAWACPSYARASADGLRYCRILFGNSSADSLLTCIRDDAPDPASDAVNKLCAFHG
jgi:hypothetical protein